MKLTPWFKKRKPFHIGVYQQRSGGPLREIGYQRWDGTKWFCWCETPEEAAAEIYKVADSNQNDPWRGLAEDPSESGPGGFFQSREALDMGK